MHAASASDRVQLSVPSVQLHPVPLMALAVKPLGNVSVTVAVPLVGPVPTLLAVMVYVAAVCPCVKFPVWVLVILKSGVRAVLIVVVSLAVSLLVLASPPPETVAAL